MIYFEDAWRVSDVSLGINLKPKMREKIVVGHRGAPNHAPENTLKGYAAAWKLGADMVELDVQETRDGSLICIHDYDLGRTTSGNGKVAESSLANIRELDAGEGEKVPLLSEALDLAKGDFALDIEIKTEGIEDRALDLVKEHDMIESVIFSSFSENAVSSLRNLSDKAAIGLIVKSSGYETVDCATELGMDFIAPLFYQLTEDSVSYAHEAGLGVYPWTVNDEDYMKQMLDWNTDGIISDIPGVCAQVVDKHLQD
ncbi:MAG: glycerophosphodiester phosphodiesterase family protein [Candidatus Thorarchaeota archaeon]